MSTINLARAVDVHRTRRPDELAIVSEERNWTYEELAADVHALTAFLREREIRLGDRVALLGLNSGRYVVALLAIYRVGAVAVPLNYRLQNDELEYLLGNSGSVAIFADEEFAGVTDAVATGDVRTRVCLAADAPAAWLSFDEAVAARRGVEASCAEVVHADVQRLMYTSGTTSRPKGVQITHGMMLCNIAAMTSELGLTSADRVLISSPLYHIAALDAPGLTVLFAGGTLVLMRKFDAAVALRLMSEQRVTGGIFVQAMLHALRDAREASVDLSSVRWMIFGAAAGELYRDIRDQFPTARLIQSYGMTEACSMIACVPEVMTEKKYGTVGTSINFVEYRVVGTDDEPVGPGGIGEIVIRGPKVTPGYWGNASATETAWRNGWFHTGDIGSIDEDGYLSILDRLKDMIRSGGENVASQEIERVIYTHPAVQEAAVVGVPDPKWDEVPKAYIVLKEGQSVAADDLIAHCRSKLASFKTPRYVEFLDILPRNPSGKVLKRALREQGLSVTADAVRPG